MKPNARLRSLLHAASSALLSMTFASAATLYWDSNGTATAGAGVTPTGTWGSSVFWTTDSTGANVGAPTLISATTNADDLFFVAGPGAASGNNAYTVTVSGAQVANSLTFQASGATTVSGGTSITLGNGNPAAGGITMNTNAFGSTAQGAATISTAIVLNNSQTWTNNAASALSLGGNLSLGANTLTFSGTGSFTWTTGSFGNAGSGGIIMNGSGVLNVRAATNTNYTGSTTINSGVVLLNGGSKSTGNFTLNGGMVTDYFQQTGVFSSGLGNGINQIQIYGESGFGAGNGTSNWRIGAAGSVLIWGASGEGSATGFFNPTTLKFMTPVDNLGPTIYGLINFDNGLNLNGATRTIDVRNASANPTTSGASIAGVISNGSLIKTGGGNLTLANAGNSWAGTTTISGGFLTVAATGALGSASNTLIFNGGTLRATGTVTSPATRAVTMTQTGIIDNNGQAISIAGNIGGSGGLTKNGTGTLTLSGTNTFGGVTTVNAGTMQFTNEVSLVSNTAANLNVISGATLALNVGGAGQFTATSINSLLSNISVANNAAEGLQAGAFIGLDTTGGTFTQGNVIANSTGAFGGAIGLTKLGTGTLILDKANTYTGPTTISAGTLQLNAGGVIATPITNNAIFSINSAAAVTQGTNFGLIGGTGAVTNAGTGTLTLNLANTYSGTTTASAGTIALANSLAIQNSALVTTSGTTTYSGGAALTTGGLSGATGDLGSANVLNGYTGLVTALTLNPQSGVTVTYGGVISDGSGAMSLTKTGAGTQILTGVNTYTGATIVNAGTLTIGVGGSISSSSALQINGGTFSNGNTSGQTLNGFTVGAGNATVSNTAASGTLALGAITRTAGLFGTVNFATLTSPISTTTGNVNSIIGPWATTGSGTTLRYVVGSSDGVTPTNITPFTTGTTATANTLANVSDATLNYEYSAAVAAMPASTALTGNTLRYSGAATTTAINATSTLTLNGLMNAGSAGPLVISGGPTTGGLLIGSTGELVINSNTQGTTISAAIGGTGRLVYNGAGSRLLLSSTTSNYSGGTVINSGQLAIASDAALGNASGSITLNGGTMIGNTTNPQAGNTGGVSITSAREVIVGSMGGSIGAHGNNTFTTTGKLSGTGTLTFADVGGAGGRGLTFNATNNDFTGRISIQSNSMTFSVNSLLDTAGSGNIALNLGAANNGSTFTYGVGAIAPLALNNRAIELNAAGAFSATIQNNNTTQSISIGSNLIATGAGAKTLTLNAVAGPSNVISSNINNGTGGGNIAVTVSGAGTWTISGNSTYTGQTTVTGTATLTLSGDNSGMLGGVVLSTNTSNNPRLNINSATALGTGVLNFGGGAATDVVRIDNTSAGAVTVSTANAITMNRNFTFVGTRDLNLGTGVTTIGGLGGVSGIRTITVTANTLTLAGPIGEAAAGAAITKAGSGTLVLSGLNSYTGNTTVANNGGNLQITSAGALPSTGQISLAKTGTGTGTLQMNVSGTNTFANAFANFSSSNGLFNGGSANIQNMQGNTTFTGNMTITSGGGNGVNIQSDAGLLTISGNLTGNVAASTRPFDFGGVGDGVFSGQLLDGNTASSILGGLTKNGAGTWSVTGINSSYTGITTINAGILNVAKLANSGSNSSLGANGAIQLAGGTLQFTGSGAQSSNRSFQVLPSSGSIDASGATSADVLTISGTFTSVDPGSTAISFTNGSNIALATGATDNRFAVGMVLSGVTGLPAGTTITAQNGNALTLSNTFTGATGSPTTTLGVVARSLTLTGSNAGANTVSSILGNSSGGGALSLIKSGTGTWVLSGSNTYTGTTSVSAGTLALGANNALPNSSAVSIGAAILNAATFSDTVGTLDVTAAAVINLGTGGALAFADSSAVDWTGGTLNITGTLGATALRFGTSSSGLTPAQLAVITVNGSGAGTYTLDADGYLVGGGSDMTPPTLTSIADDKTGGPVNIGTVVTYTVTFSEDIDSATVTAADFNNNGTAGITIGAINETSAGVFTVAVTTNSPGSLKLRIPTGAVIKDVAGNDLVVPVEDDTTLTVRTPFEAWANAAGATGGSTGDPDGDGFVNLMEYGFDTNPTSSSAASIAYANGVVTAHGQPILVEENGFYYAVFGRRVDHVAAGLTYTVEFSAGLDQWTASATGLSTVATDGTIDAVRAPFPITVMTPSGPKKPTFFRVVVSQP